jgi:hypothetical protein
MTEGTVRVTGPCVNEPLAAPNHKVFTCVPAPPVVIARPSVAAPVATERPRLEQTATTLFAAAEHARLAGAEADARRLYGAVRERFPGTDEAGKSAFLLGRMSDASGASDDAVRWFGLAAEERGGLATAALGRLIELEQKRGNGSRARSLAAHYLEKHPDGPHAAYAASIVEAHP